MECVVEESYKTAVLLCRIEYAIERYQKLALQAADKTAAVRCNALIDLYIADEKIKVAEISEKLMLKKSQVYNYIGAAIEEVAALLFPDEEQDTTITENENT